MRNSCECAAWYFSSSLNIVKCKYPAALVPFLSAFVPVPSITRPSGSLLVNSQAEEVEGEVAWCGVSIMHQPAGLFLALLWWRGPASTFFLSLRVAINRKVTPGGAQGAAGEPGDRQLPIGCRKSGNCWLYERLYERHCRYCTLYILYNLNVCICHTDNIVHWINR